MTQVAEGSSLSGLAVSRGDRPVQLNSWHILAILVCACGLFADIAEVAVGNVLAAVFLAPPYSMPRAGLSLLLASVFAGGAAGAPLFGWFADRYGRRRALTAALCLMALASLAAAAMGNVVALTCFRFATGLAIGAYPPLTAAYLSEILPAKHRGTLMMCCAGLAFLGAPAVILLMRELSPATLHIEAWRWVLGAGGILAGVTAWFFRFLPESPHWLAAARFAPKIGAARDGVSIPGDALPPHSGAARLEAASRDALPVRRLAFLLALYVLGPWATLGFPLLSAAGMVSKGFAVGDSVLFAGLSMFGPVIGIFSAACFVDRLDRRITVSLCAAAMAVFGTAFAIAGTLTPLVLIGVAFNLASALYSAILSIYAAEMFPTAMRASATAGSWGAGRLVSIFVAPGLLYILTGYGQAAMCAAIVASPVISLVLILFAGPPGRPGLAIDAAV